MQNVDLAVSLYNSQLIELMQIIDLFHYITVKRLSMSGCNNELKNLQFENKKKVD